MDGNCYYCGVLVTGKGVGDHVIARSTLRQYQSLGIKVDPRRILIVPCCPECNSLLGASVQETLQERKAYLKVRLRRKYRRLLRTAEWTENELAGLGAQLRGHIEGTQKERIRLKGRLAW